MNRLFIIAMLIIASSRLGFSEETTVIVKTDPHTQFFVGIGKTKSPDSDNALSGLLDFRTGYGYLTLSLDANNMELKRAGGNASLQATVLPIGPIRTGLGLRYMYVPVGTVHDIPTLAYVRSTETEEIRHALFAVADTGIGRYDGTYVRGFFMIGRAQSPIAAEIYMFDRPKLLERKKTRVEIFKISGAGAEAGFKPVKFITASASYTHLWMGEDVPAYFPQQQNIFESSVTLRTPIHIGVTVSGRHATPSGGLVFLNDSASILVGFAF